MRNLKRALSLALASMMLLGMMVIGAGAASVNDMDKVVNKEAVALMVDLGIIEGDNAGNFNPTGTINRAGVAKLAYYVQMGDADPSVYAGMNYFTDTTGHWADGYINYCYSQGLLDGRGDGTFNPGGSLPVVGLAKVLLNTLGYDSELEGYVGTGWTINATREAQSIGLLNGVTQGMTDIVTRDTAAQMFYNALFINTRKVTYTWDQGIRRPDGYEKSSTSLGFQVYGLVKLTATVSGITAGKATLSNVTMNGSSATVAGTAINNALPATPDMLNTAVNVYVKGSVSGSTVTVADIYSTSLVVADTKTVATVNGYTSTGTTALTALLSTAATKVASLEAGKTIEDLKYFYNGVNLTDASSPDNTGIDTEAEARAQVGKNGVIVEFKDLNTTAGVDTVVITEKKVTTLATAPIVSTDADGKKQVTISSLGLNKAAADTVVGYENLAKGDVVLSVVIGGVTYIEKAASVKGVATAKNNFNAIRVDGTYYGTSSLSGTTYAGASWSDYKNTYTFYLDNNNSIVKAVAETTSTTVNYAVLLETGWVGTGTEIGGTSYAQAKLLFADGTTDVVTLASVDGMSIVKTGGDDSNTEDYDDLTPDVFYTYNVNATTGAYSLTTVNATEDNIEATEIKNDVLFDGKNVGNSATIFLVVSGSSAKPVYTAYTGVANVPGMKGLTKADSDIVTVNGVATLVYVKAIGATVTGTVGEYIYIPSKLVYNEYPATSTSNAYIEVEAVIEGQTVAIKFATGSNITIGGSGTKTFKDDVNAQTIYEVVAKDANGIISEIKAVDTETGINVAAGGTLSVGATPDVYTYGAETVVYYFDEDGVCTTQSYDTLTVDATDKVVVVSADGKFADVVYVQQVIETDATASSITYAVNGKGSNDTNAKNTTYTGTVAAQTAGSKITFDVTTTSKGATYTVSPSSIETPANSSSDATVLVTVIAEDGVTTATYTITVTKAAS